MGRTILGQSGEDTAQSTSALQEARLPPANYCSKHIHTPKVPSCIKASIYLGRKKHQLARGAPQQDFSWWICRCHERGDGKGAGTGQGDAWGHCTGQKQVEGEERLEQHSRFSHYNLQHLCCNYTHICTRLTSLRSSPSHLVAVSWTP